MPERNGPRPGAWKAVARLVLCTLALAGGAAADGAVDGLVNEARRLYEAGAVDDAGARLKEAVEGHPGHLPARQWLAVIRHQQGRRDEALFHYRAVQSAALAPLAYDAPETRARERDLVVRCEALLTALINDERLSRGLPLYLPDLHLIRISRGHSEEMRDLNYFDHKSPTAGRRTIRDRFLAVVTGRLSYTIGENIARRYASRAYSLTEDNAARTHSDWMNSRGHRANIVHTGFERVGIALSVNDKGDYWATQFFARY